MPSYTSTRSGSSRIQGERLSLVVVGNRRLRLRLSSETRRCTSSACTTISTPRAIPPSPARATRLPADAESRTRRKCSSRRPKRSSPGRPVVLVVAAEESSSSDSSRRRESLRPNPNPPRIHRSRRIRAAPRIPRTSPRRRARRPGTSRTASNPSIESTDGFDRVRVTTGTSERRPENHQRPRTPRRKLETCNIHDRALDRVKPRRSVVNRPSSGV